MTESELALLLGEPDFAEILIRVWRARMWKNLGNAGFGPFGRVQRHHLIPNEIVNARCFGSFFRKLRGAGFCPHDLQTNGMILPSCEATAMATGMPLHRGPHPAYSAMIAHRIAAIERNFRPTRAGTCEALVRIRMLQKGSRKGLEARRFKTLNRRDPFSSQANFAHIDQHIALIENLVG